MRSFLVLIVLQFRRYAIYLTTFLAPVFNTTHAVFTLCSFASQFTTAFTDTVCDVRFATAVVMLNFAFWNLFLRLTCRLECHNISFED